MYPAFSSSDVILLVQLVKLGGVVGKLKVGIGEGGDEDTKEVAGRVPSPPHLVAVQGGSDVEDDQGQDEANGWDPVSQPPAQVLLDVNEAERGEECAGEGAEHPPVEEGSLELLLMGI